MKTYQTKYSKLAGTDYHEVYKKAFGCYKKVRAKTKRRPYVRSAYFKKDKIFLAIFWSHLKQKNWSDRLRRMRYLPCAIELIRHSKFEPTSKENPNKHGEILHRFSGITADKDLFFVQIKEDKKTGQKYFLSTFPMYDK